jgi:hypothetical protein
MKKAALKESANASRSQIPSRLSLTATQYRSQLAESPSRPSSAMMSSISSAKKCYSSTRKEKEKSKEKKKEVTNKERQKLISTISPRKKN